MKKIVWITNCHKNELNEVYKNYHESWNLEIGEPQPIGGLSAEQLKDKHMKNVTKYGGITFMILVLVFWSWWSCTANTRAKKYGGTLTEQLAADQKLINVTWKDEQLWILTRPMRPDEFAETYSFREKSKYGLVEGEVRIMEKKGR